MARKSIAERFATANGFAQQLGFESAWLQAQDYANRSR